MWYQSVFWIFPISRSRLETTCWLTPNLSASYFCVCDSSSSNNACNLTFSNFLAVFRVSCVQLRSHHFWNAETIVHTYLAMEHVHHKLLEVIGKIHQQFPSNNNKNWCCSRMLFVRYKFRHIEPNNTTHTFPIHHSIASDTCWHNKMAHCQISIAQTAVVHHLLFEIRISNLYTWYKYINIHGKMEHRFKLINWTSTKERVRQFC